MKAYSIDLRQRIVAAVERGMPRHEVAATFGVSVSTIKRLLARKRHNADDALAASSPPGRPRTIQTEHHAALWPSLKRIRMQLLQRILNCGTRSGTPQ